MSLPFVVTKCRVFTCNEEAVYHITMINKRTGEHLNGGDHCLVHAESFISQLGVAYDYEVDIVL